MTIIKGRRFNNQLQKTMRHFLGSIFFKNAHYRLCKEKDLGPDYFISKKDNIPAKTKAGQPTGKQLQQLPQHLFL